MFVVQYKRFFYTLSTILVVASIVALVVYGLNLGIDFKGGSLLEVSYASAVPEKTAIDSVVTTFGENVSVRQAGNSGFIIRLHAISEEEHQALLSALSFGGKNPVTVIRFDAIGPLLGKEAAWKSLLAVALVIICILLFIWFAFRKVSAPVASWKYGMITIIALLHDIVIPVGVFALLGHFRGTEVDTLFVTALLVVLGFSVHDKIVVFDRVRENLRLSPMKGAPRDAFEITVGKSISQTLVRSINTSLTVVFALATLLILGPSSTHMLSIALMIGIVSGTYSSICIASPLLVTAEKLQKRI